MQTAINMSIYTIDFLDATTLGRAYDGDAAEAYVSISSRDLEQWAVGLQQHRPLRRLFVLNAKIAAIGERFVYLL